MIHNKTKIKSSLLKSEITWQSQSLLKGTFALSERHSSIESSKALFAVRD